MIGALFGDPPAEPACQVRCCPVQSSKQAFADMDRALVAGIRINSCGQIGLPDAGKNGIGHQTAFPGREAVMLGVAYDQKGQGISALCRQSDLVLEMHLKKPLGIEARIGMTYR